MSDSVLSIVFEHICDIRKTRHIPTLVLRNVSGIVISASIIQRTRATIGLLKGDPVLIDSSQQRT